MGGKKERKRKKRVAKVRKKEFKKKTGNKHVSC